MNTNMVIQEVLHSLTKDKGKTTVSRPANLYYAAARRLPGGYSKGKCAQDGRCPRRRVAKPKLAIIANISTKVQRLVLTTIAGETT